jgi:uncharacterized caspase-like protein
VRTDLHWAVSIGIDQYLGLKPLRYARHDAVAMDAWLRESAGISDDKRTLVTYDGERGQPFARRVDAMPTARDVWDAIMVHIKAVRRHIDQCPEDWGSTRLVVYFAGHGIAPGALETTGLPADADQDNLGIGMSFSGLKAWLAASHDFAEVVLIADCCRKEPPDGTLTPGPSWTSVRRKRKDVQFAELYAAQFRKSAREPLEKDAADGGGYFTSALLAALNGRAPGDGPYISASAAVRYAQGRVRNATNSLQEPPEFNGADLPLAVRPATVKGVRVPVQLILTGIQDADLEVLDGAYRSLGTFRASGGVLNLSLAPGRLYKVQAPPGADLANGGLFEVDADAEEVRREL